RLLSIEAVYERIIATMDPSDTPDKFIKIFPQDLSVVQDLLSKESVKDIMTYTLSFETLSRSKTPDDRKEREEYLKKKRDKLKDAVKKAIENVNGMAPSEILSVIRLSKPYANEIIRLTKLFREEFSLAKRKQGIIDFSDMEHMALSILIDKETGQCRPPAKELRERYSYVMVDEYQDSNEVQELLLRTVSGEDTGNYNYFMVGDVKQSIYRFRMAQPKIFMNKHALFGKENGNTERIDLNKNFRSRTEVLDIVNVIFSHIMKKDIGGIDYTDSEKLYPGAEFKDAPEGADAFTPEVLIAENDAEAIEELLMDDKEELEAAIIADRIDALMKNALVTDPDTRELRPIRYSDICILLRSVKTKGEVFADTLKTHHIPSHVAGKKGYYDSAEVRTVLQFLSLIDNGYQDIPLVAVLRSPMFDISDETLINARLCDREAPFNNAFYEYAGKTDDESVRKFTIIYEKLREASLDTGVSELIRMMLEETGYLTFVTAMPDGDVRNANLRKLMDKAADYEKTGFKGLFRFIRYIENLRTYDADEESAEVVSENDDAVKIMTIHKSKGLEFPVVFVSGMGSQLRAVEKEKVTLNPELGLAIDAVDPVNMVNYKSFYREQMKSLNAHEDKGEELRVLYVALTRAKEKLIMTGVVKKLDETMLKWRETDIEGYLERKNTA
ncbi:MAG: UvrD-helicase domain-containing protein, partial [Lachnospiraceae bacterium]|nr:UvrD-helicase domain-containing protein [Lachnospiraceae bacterium]